VLEGHHGPLTGLDLGGEGPLLLSASVDRTVRLWDLYAGSQRHAWSLAGEHIVEDGVPVAEDWPTSVAFGPDHLAVVGTLGGVVHVWRTDTLERVARGGARWSEITTLAFPARTLLATGSRDGTVSLWRLPSLVLLATLVSLPEGWVAFAPDGRYKAGGRIAGEFTHAAGECRFEVGELDELVPGLRLGTDERLFDPVAEP
jgi:WD40 repeat protein